MGDHAEAIEIDFDPTIISFDNILNMFWNWHSPTRKSYSRQYMSAIFYHGDEQRRLAEESRNRLETSVGKIYTEIMPLKQFYMAEDYHQKYTLKRITEVVDEFSAIYPHHDDFVASTAVARANAYASGYGTLDMFDAEAHCYGLSPSSLLRLRKVLERFHPIRCSS